MIYSIADDVPWFKVPSLAFWATGPAVTRNGIKFFEWENAKDLKKLLVFMTGRRSRISIYEPSEWLNK